MYGCRAALLQDPFFDPQHKPYELVERTERDEMHFSDMVVLLGRLMKVLMREETGEALTSEELVERIRVRNECLDQPFFDRRCSMNDGRVFGREGEYE